MTEEYKRGYRALPVPAPADDEARVEAMARAMCTEETHGDEDMYNMTWKYSRANYEALALAALRALEGKP